jgi:hypothetical protein
MLGRIFDKMTGDERRAMWPDPRLLTPLETATK